MRTESLREMAASRLDDLINKGMTVQFTSNHEEYMHRDMESVLSDLPLCFYNMGLSRKEVVDNRSTGRVLPGSAL